MGGDGSISQSELDKLFGTNGGLEDLPEMDDAQNIKHVWIIKNTTNGGVCGGRCWSVWDAQAALARAQKDYPDSKFEIRQVR